MLIEEKLIKKWNLKVCQFCINLIGITTEDRAEPESDTDYCLPFTGSRCALAQMRLAGATAAGKISEFMGQEEMAFALSQVNAHHVLPPLTELACGSDLLSYRVNLREQLDHSLINELRMVLLNQGKHLHWEQIREQSYLCVIGAGVAACVDMSPKEEVLHLRYASSLQNELFHAGRTLDLPRSRLFLQAALYEKFDLLLTKVRQNAWYWMYGSTTS